jgi:ligand-binding sensor domain-containing protein
MLGVLTTFSAYGTKPNVLNFYRYQYQAANKNWAIGQDAQGIMYFGNDKGLLEFDGLRWQLYSPPGDKLIRTLAVAPDGRVYTGGYEEFGYWQAALSGALEYTSLSRLLKEGVMHNDDIWKILPADDYIYFQSFKQVYLYELQTGEVSACSNPAGHILFLYEVHGQFWVQAMGGALYKLSGKEFIKIPGSEIFSQTEVRIILPYDTHCLIGTSSKGLYLYDGASFSYWDTDFSREVIPYELNNGIRGSQGHYFFGTILNGLYEVDAGGHIVNHLSAADLLQNNTVLNLYEEESGNIWLALDRGISYVQYIDRMDTYIVPKGHVGAVYSSAIHKGDLYLGTNQGLFYLPLEDLNESGCLTSLRFVEGSQGQIWDLKEIEGELLCGHNNGLKIVVNRRLTASIPGITGVYRIQQLDASGRLILLGTYTTANVLRKEAEPRGWTLVENRDLSLFVEPVYRIQPDHLGNIWLEHTKKGVYRCIFSADMRSIKYIQKYERPQAHLQIFRIGERVVFAGNDSIFVYNDIENKLEFHERLTRSLEGIHNLRNIVPISKTRFWALTDHCLYDIFYDGHESRIHYKFDLNYDNLSLINSYENIVLLNDSLSLICLDNGFLLNTLSREILPTQQPRPCLRSIAAINPRKQTQYLDKNQSGARLSFGYNTLRFAFFVRNMLAQKRYFQTKLVGVDEHWSAPRQIPEVVYERLPKGDYRFMLRTTDAFGECSEETTFHFTILSPWYFSRWAYLGYLLLLLCLAYGGWAIWFRRMQNREILKVRMREEQRLKRLNNELQEEIEHKSSELYAQTMYMIRKNELIEKVKNEISNFYNGLSRHKTQPLYERIEALLNQNMDAEEDWKMFLIQFEQHHQDFFKHLISTYPDLTSNDLKLCACLKLNLSSKDIAALLSISLRGVENSRYRLRKKLQLAPNQNLNDFFLRL